MHLRNRKAEPLLPFNSRIRPRRNRNTPVVRSMVRETNLSPRYAISLDQPILVLTLTIFLLP